MKILLLGEFSGLHKNLSEGLDKLGHNVLVASSGDGWKKIDSDIGFPIAGSDLIGTIRYRMELYNFISRIKNFDVVQLINPFIFPLRFFPKKKLIDDLIANNGKLFLLGAGSDAYFWRYGRKILRYSPFDDYLKYDLKASKDPLENPIAFKYNKYIADSCAGIIPIMYEYEACYTDHYNLCKTIPIPINIDKIDYIPNKVNGKLVVFHGLNRYGFKGTRYIEEAFGILRSKYPNDLELIIDGHMPLNNYLKLMRRTNVVIDQSNSYSSGVNGIYALAMGKVVLGGAEPESLYSLGVNKSPIINIYPSTQDIINKILFLLDNKSCIESIGLESRRFAESVHGYIDVAQKYVNAWQSRQQ